ncbi:MAG: hypothetical protein ACRDRY_21255 [Pseudonocardiaceae bacterium]
MSKIFGREIGALSGPKFAGVPGTFWVDLTAGDGVAANGGPWTQNCSPGILAHHARFHRNVKPVQVVMFEKAARTYATLLGNLTAELPNLGYQRITETDWTCGPATLTAVNADSASFDPASIPDGWAVQVVNDPNAINTWAMDPGLMSAVKARSRLCLGMSTMGCNAAGLKRLDRAEREGWYGHVQAQIDGLHRHHDLLLATIERDAHQWAYLVTAPSVWREEVAGNARGAFGKGGFTLRCLWLRDGLAEFESLLDYLFLTSKERSE